MKIDIDELGPVQRKVRVELPAETVAGEFSRAYKNLAKHWCERGESNPHGCPLDPKSSASASSATLARHRRLTNFLNDFDLHCRVKITHQYVKRC